MYSRLNLIINALNFIGINKLGEADNVRRIISLLPQQKNGSIITILHNMEDLSAMTSTIVIGKITVFELSRKMRQQDEPTSSKPYAFACEKHEKMKGKKKAPSSREEEEEDDDDEEDDDQPLTSFSKDKETV
jgi:ABC-type multidrug transport system ATPase subunit